MLNKDNKPKIENLPFDHSTNDMDEFDNQFGDVETADEESLADVRGQSELVNDRKLHQKGQKAIIIFLSVIAIAVAAWLTYKLSSPKTKVEEKKVEAKTKFETDNRTFADDFAASAAASTPTYEVVSSAPTNEPPANTAGVGGTYPRESIEPPHSYSNPYNNYSEVSQVQPPAATPSPSVTTTAAEPTTTIVEAPTTPIEVASAPTVLTPEEERKLRIYKSGLGIAPASSASNPGKATAANNGSQSKDPLVSSLTPAALDGTSAAAMKNRDFMLTKGSIIDCVLNTKFDSNVIGMMTCTTTRNIYSASGRVVLIDRGSKVTGEYKGGIQQGQSRVFVLWNRIETPKGIIIDINSPGAGSLGEAGLDGRIDSKFFKRFSGAMLVSFINDLGRAVSEAIAKKSTDANVNLEDSANTAQQMAAAELEKSINIPPSLIKHQGDRLSIYVARDIYFGDVYELKRK